MKITTVEIDPVGPELPIELSFKDPQTQNPFNVMQILGLDADEIVASYYGTYGDSKFFRLAPQRRVIVVRISLNPSFELHETYERLRDRLYKTISASRNGTVVVTFLNEMIQVASVTGFVTKFETAQFERNQEVQITIKCDDSLLRQPVPTVVELAGQSTGHFIVYDGDSTAPHGVYMRFRVLSTVASLSLTDPLADSWSFTVTPPTSFILNDRIHIRSDHGSKELYRVRAGVTTHLADSLVQGSIWPIVFPGDNRYAIGIDETKFALEAIEHHRTYWGV